MHWIRYPQMDRISGLRNSGRELLGHEIILQEKLDGSNIALWPKIEDNKFLGVNISSHNMEVAEESLQNQVRLTTEYTKIVDLLQNEFEQYGGQFIAYGEYVPAGKGPTRVQPKRKKASWVMFDLYNTATNRFENQTLVYQKGYQWKIPVVKTIRNWVPRSMEELSLEVPKLKAWARRHRREGVILKVYEGDQVFAKEKIDILELPRIHKPSKKELDYPAMPEDTIQRALAHARDEVGLENWRDKRLAMPVVAKAIALEAREHLYSAPRNIFFIYEQSLQSPPEPRIDGEKTITTSPPVMEPRNDTDLPSLTA